MYVQVMSPCAFCACSSLSSLSYWVLPNIRAMGLGLCFSLVKYINKIINFKVIVEFKETKFGYTYKVI